MSFSSERSVSVDDATLSVGLAGDGPPILLIHAYPLRRELYRDVVQPFTEHGTVIAADNRGFGQSSVTAGCVAIEKYADDLANVLEQVTSDQPAVVAGVSMGGYIAMRLLARHPHRVRGLLLCNTRLAPDTPDAAAKRESLAQKIEADGTGVIRGVPEKLLGETSQSKRSELVEEIRQWVLATDPNGIAAALRGMAARPDSTELIREASVPVQFIGGSEDPFTPADEMRETAQATGRPITVIDGAGHLSPIEQPTAFADAAAAFIRSLPPLT